jgi:hypothetical protein
MSSLLIGLAIVVALFVAIRIALRIYFAGHLKVASPAAGEPGRCRAVHAPVDSGGTEAM